MEKTNELKGMSTEELMEKRRKLKKTTLIIGSIMGALFLFLIFTVIKTKKYDFLPIVAASLCLLPAFKQLKEIDNELKERHQSQSFK